MNRRQNIINNIILLAATVLSVLAVTLVANNNYNSDLFTIVVLFIVGALIACLVNSFVHELGHMIAARRHGFEIVSMRLFVVSFMKIGGKLKVGFTGMKEELGETEIVPKTDEDLDKRLVKVTRAGVYGTLILLVLSILPMIFAAYMPMPAYTLIAPFFPVAVYYFFANALPMTGDGVRNDAAVIVGLKKQDDVAKVTLGLMKIHAALFHGATPAEIEESLYYDLPQLPEDDPNFTLLLNARYQREVDSGDYERAKKTSFRLSELLDDMPKIYRNPVQADLLYNACTFDFDAEKADNFVEDIEKYLNGTNSVTNLRIKAAYLLYVVKDHAAAREFIAKAERDAEHEIVKGEGSYEKKLLGKLLDDLREVPESSLENANGGEDENKENK